MALLRDCHIDCHPDEMMLKRTMDNVKHGEVKHAANPGRVPCGFGA